MKNITSQNKKVLFLQLLLILLFFVSKVNIQGIFIDKEKEKLNEFLITIDETENNMKKLKNHLPKDTTIFLWKKMSQLKKDIIKIHCKEKKIPELEKDFIYLQMMNNSLQKLIIINKKRHQLKNNFPNNLQNKS